MALVRIRSPASVRTVCQSTSPGSESHGRGCRHCSAINATIRTDRTGSFVARAISLCSGLLLAVLVGRSAEVKAIDRSRGRVAAQAGKNTFECVEVTELHQHLAASPAAELDLDRRSQQIRQLFFEAARIGTTVVVP